jgi:hypothetical protein
MSQPTVYDTDILEWSEQQASALRELARARPDLSNVIDWENVAEEIECVGRSEFNAVRSLIRRIFIHLIKALSVPDRQALLHRHSEVRAFHSDLLDRLAPSMIVRMDVERPWQRAIKDATAALQAHGESIAARLPLQCPLTAAELADPEFDFVGTVEKARAQIGGSRV